MKMYKAPTVETVKLEFVDVITTSGGEKGIDTTAYMLKNTTSTSTKITHTNKGEEWQSNWN